jgi:hypothetical protein
MKLPSSLAAIETTASCALPQARALALATDDRSVSGATMAVDAAAATARIAPISGQ